MTLKNDTVNSYNMGHKFNPKLCDFKKISCQYFKISQLLF